MSEYAIVIDGLTKRFGDEEVLHNISQSFEVGAVHGIAGNNGSGKTVLFKCICGYCVPTSGSVTVQGKKIGVDRDFPESLGLIIESPGFMPHLSAFQNLQILASLKSKISKDVIRQVIQMVGLDPNSKKPVGKYSLGMRQRLGMAQAIMEDPQCLILDEPFNGLDKHGVEDMRALIQRLKQEGKTILMASHNASDIEILCDHVYEMEAGYLKKIS